MSERAEAFLFIWASGFGFGLLAVYLFTALTGVVCRG